MKKPADWKDILQNLTQGSIKHLSRAISLVENQAAGYDELLRALPHNRKKIIGITGPPGSGKSTLVNALIAEITARQKSVGILCVDPSSPFNLGALLGDRIRMSDWFNNPLVFIRSLASRGSLGGLHPRIIEVAELVKAAPFDYVIVETVGVGQSEIEIAGLADLTIVVLVPEAGDEIQVMKAGLMEIADIFVVNKADRPDANNFTYNLQQILSAGFAIQKKEIPIVKTVASSAKGIDTLFEKINEGILQSSRSERKLWLLTERAYHLIQDKRMKDVDKAALKQKIEMLESTHAFNLYAFIQQY